MMKHLGWILLGLVLPFTLAAQSAPPSTLGTDPVDAQKATSPGRGNPHAQNGGTQHNGTQTGSSAPSVLASNTPNNTTNGSGGGTSSNGANGSNSGGGTAGSGSSGTAGNGGAMTSGTNTGAGSGNGSTPPGTTGGAGNSSSSNPAGTGSGGTGGASGPATGSGGTGGGSGPATGSTGSTGGGGTGGGGTGGGGGSNSSMQVVDLGGGAGQDIDISNSTSTSYQFPSTQGTISVQVGTDGSVTLIGSSGASDLQMQTNPTPMSGVETINQSLKITGVTSLSVKMIDGKIFVSLRLDPNNVTVTYNDITPDGETRPKENYAFKFIVAGYPPVIIPNGKTLSLRQNREALQARMADSFTATGAMYFHSRSDITVRFGSSLLPAPVSP